MSDNESIYQPLANDDPHDIEMLYLHASRAARLNDTSQLETAPSHDIDNDSVGTVPVLTRAFSDHSTTHGGSAQLPETPQHGHVSPSLGSGMSSVTDKHAENGNPSTATRLRPSSTLGTWWIEISACAIALVTLIAIIATLYPHQRKPLPQWPYSLSVNTLLAIYTAVLKATLLATISECLGQLKWIWFSENRPLDNLVAYDDATRGPLGALRLLWLLRFRDILSSAAAVVTLSLLVIDPFTQQLVRYYGCSVPAPGLNATIPRTNLFVPKNIFAVESSNSSLVGIDSTAGWIEPGLQAVFSTGTKQSDQTVNPFCHSGHCAFSRGFDSIGYESKCTDITEKLDFSSVVIVGGLTSVVDFESVEKLDNGSYVPTKRWNAGHSLQNTNFSTNTSLPSGLYITNEPGWDFNFTTMKTFGNFPTGNDSFRVEIIVGQQYKNFVPSTGQAPTGCDSRPANESWYCKGFGAASCTIRPCIHSYTSTVEAGKLHERRVTSSGEADHDWGLTVPTKNHVGDLAILDTNCISEDERQSLKGMGYDIERAGRWMAYNLTFDPILSNMSKESAFPESMMAKDCLYIVSSAIAQSLWDSFLTNFFKGTVSGHADVLTINSLTGPQFLQEIYNNGNVTFDRVDNIFHDVSQSLTRYVRQESPSKFSVPAQGIVLQDQTCLSVRWSWLAFPTLLAILTLLIFTWALIRSRPKPGNMPLWKSSPLALFFHGIAGLDRRQADIGDLKYMTSIAKKTNVRLSPKGDTFQFTESKIPSEKAK